MTKGRYLKLEDFTKIKDLQSHGYNVLEASKWSGWSRTTVNRAYMLDSYNEYKRALEENSPKPRFKSSSTNNPLPLEEATINIISQEEVAELVAAIRELTVELVSNTKATWALRRDLTESNERLINALIGTPEVIINKQEEDNA